MAPACGTAVGEDGADRGSGRQAATMSFGLCGKMRITKPRFLHFNRSRFRCDSGSAAIVIAVQCAWAFFT
jgi:hypothetical protein